MGPCWRKREPGGDPPGIGYYGARSLSVSRLLTPSIFLLKEPNKGLRCYLSPARSDRRGGRLVVAGVSGPSFVQQATEENCTFRFPFSRFPLLKTNFGMSTTEQRFRSDPFQLIQGSAILLAGFSDRNSTVLSSVSPANEDLE